MIIDKDYPGLVDEGIRYSLDGDIDAVEGVFIKLDKPLFVSGDITTDGYINAEGDISAGGYISAGGNIWAGGDISAGGYILAGGDIWADGYISAGGYIKCAVLVHGAVIKGELKEEEK